MGGEWEGGGDGLLKSAATLKIFNFKKIRAVTTKIC